jgi:hypothetical protein
MNRFDFIRYLFEDCHIIQQFCKDATQCSSAICIIKNQNEKNNRTKNNINQSKEIVFSKKSVFVILYLPNNTEQLMRENCSEKERI